MGRASKMAFLWFCFTLVAVAVVTGHAPEGLLLSLSVVMLVLETQAYVEQKRGDG